MVYITLYMYMFVFGSFLFSFSFFLSFFAFSQNEVGHERDKSQKSEIAWTEASECVSLAETRS